MTLCTRLSVEKFVSSPSPGTAVHAVSQYSHPVKHRLTSMHGYETRSDTCDVAFLRYSDDNGRTWSEPDTFDTEFADPNGTGRRHFRGTYADPMSGKALVFWTEGVLPSDDPLEGLRQWKLYYAILSDDGRSFAHRAQIIHEGPGYDPHHHLPGVTVGHNCAMMGDYGERPLTRRDGVILLPVQSSPTGPDGMYANPGAGYTYTDALVLLGRWKDDGTLSWTASQRIEGDPKRTTRGMIEPTLAELADGRLLIVMRGSNDRRPELPGYRWHAFSTDGGMTWTTPAPWTFTDGTPFHSPSSCSQLIPWHDGRIFWMGNICKENPRGNAPRYPMMLAEVDPRSGLLIRESLTVLDDRAEDESPMLTLSNFYAREDRETGHLLLHMCRLFPHQVAGEPTDWSADALLYRFAMT